ncbi:MAG: hypothetical protein JWM59_61 [Verrucomicrobiales bacterium]|nr:hypothetical protein [Verrucomicrobiales bacterium]
MKFPRIFISTSLLAAAVIILSPADAKSALALVDQGDTTFDPNTGLIWLDLSFTQGQSYNAILNGAGNFTTSLSYRFATAAEVKQLFLNAGAISLGNPPAPGNLPAAHQAVTLLGSTFSTLDGNRSWMFYDHVSDPQPYSPNHVSSAVFGEGFTGGGHIGWDGFFLTPGMYAERDYSSPELASALVKAVPEPSLPLLLCVGTALLLAGRKR